MHASQNLGQKKANEVQTKKASQKSDFTAKLLEKILKRITPSEEEKKKELAVVKGIIKRISSIKGKHIKAMLCGSLARDTHLRGEQDFDIFVLFDKELPRDEFEQLGLKIGIEALKGYEHWLEYSEHPYVKGIVDGYEVEIVPCYKVSKACLLKSSVDRSPFHARFIQKNIRPEQKKEVRLLKAFMKGIGCYGADIASEGFSGYLAELLILKYGTFLDCVNAASQWTPGLKIALNEGHLKKCKVTSTLVFPDPTDPKRNVASAVSLEQFSRFVFACKKFLERPSEKFFLVAKQKIPTQISLLLKERHVIAVCLRFERDEAKDTVLGQMKRLKNLISQELEKNEFKVFASSIANTDKDVYCFLELERNSLGKLAKVIGPPVFDEKNVKAFLKKHKRVVSGPRIENDRIVVVEKRKKLYAREFVNDLILFLSKQGKEPIKSMLKKAVILENRGLVKRCKKPEFAHELARFLIGRERFL